MLNALGIIGASVVSGILAMHADGDGYTHPFLAMVLEIVALTIIFIS